MVSAFSQFSLPQIASVARRTALAAAGVAGAALVVTFLLGYGLVGLGVCVGMAMALVNFRMISAATAKAANTGRESNRRPLAVNTLGRLGVISAIALGFVFLSRRFGFGIIVGLAVFQFLLLANVVVSMLRDPAFAAAPSDRGEQELPEAP